MDMYESEQVKGKYEKSAQYYFAMFLKGIMYIVTMVVKIIIQVMKGVLRTFGVPIPK